MGSTWYRTIMAIANEILILKNNSIIKYTVTVFMVLPRSYSDYNKYFFKKQGNTKYDAVLSGVMLELFNEKKGWF